MGIDEREDIMPEATTFVVPRYVLHSVERALDTARKRVRAAQDRADKLEATLAAMKADGNYTGKTDTDSDTNEEGETE